MATISECRYRWLRVPATAFVITHSPSRSNRRDRFSFSGERRGRATEQVRLRAALPGSSRVMGGRLLSTEHPEKLLSRALSTKEWGQRIYVEEKSSFDIFTTNLGSGVRISSGAPFRYKAGYAKPAVFGPEAATPHPPSHPAVSAGFSHPTKITRTVSATALCATYALTGCCRGLTPLSAA